MTLVEWVFVGSLGLIVLYFLIGSIKVYPFRKKEEVMPYASPQRDAWDSMLPSGRLVSVPEVEKEPAEWDDTAQKLSGYVDAAVSAVTGNVKKTGVPSPDQNPIKKTGKTPPAGGEPERLTPV